MHALRRNLKQFVGTLVTLLLLAVAMTWSPWYLLPVFYFLPTVVLFILFSEVLCDAKRLAIAYSCLFIPVLIFAPFTSDWGCFSLTGFGTWAHDDPAYGFYSLAAVCFAGWWTQNGRGVDYN